MSAITSFTATHSDSAIDFSWNVNSSLINSTTIKKITIVTNDYAYDALDTKTSVTRHDITPIVVGGTVTLTATVSNLVPGVEYGAVLLITVANGTTYSKSLTPSFIKVKSVPIKPTFNITAFDTKFKIQVTNYILENGNVSQDAIGHDTLSKIYVYVSSADDRSFVVHSFSPSDIHNLPKILTGDEHGIVNDKEYEIAIQTENSIGLSAMSDTITKTSRNTPDFIEDYFALPQVVVDGSNLLQNVIAFGNTTDAIDPLSIIYPIQKYTLRRYLADEDGNAVGDADMSYNSFPLDASGLSTANLYTYDGVTYPFVYIDTTAVQGTNYVYSVNAENINGPGEETYMPVMRTGRLASAPTITLDSSNSIIEVDVTDPTDFGGFDVSAGYYRYTLFNRDTEEELTYTLTSPHTFTGLTNGTTYDITVQAITYYINGDIYYGLPATGSITPFDEVPAPTGLSLDTAQEGAPLNGQIQVTWDPVTFTNPAFGSLMYMIFIDGSNVATIDGSLNITTYLIEGLINGQEYEIGVQVRITNIETGEYLYSSINSGLETPFTYPANATNLALSRNSSTSLTFTYNIPGGSGLGDTNELSRIYVYDITDASYVLEDHDLSGNTGNVSYEFNGTEGHSYRFEVYTGVYSSKYDVNYINESYEEITGTAYAEPNAPTLIAQIPVSNGFTIRWEEPALNGTTLVGYDISVNGIVVATDFSGTTYIIEGSNNVVSTVSVRTKGSVLYPIGSDENPIYSNYSGELSVTPQAPPSQPVVTSSGINGTITLTWPIIPGATGYEVDIDGETYYYVGDSNFTTDGSNITFTLSGLNAAGTSYSYNVRSYKVDDWEDNYYSTDATGDVVPLGAPNAPTNLVCLVSPNTINATWEDTQTSEFTMLYRLVIDASYADSEGEPHSENIFDISGITDASGVADILDLTVTSQLLSNGNRYLVRVYAYFVAYEQTYESEASNVVAVVINDAPQEVSNFTVTEGNQTNTLTWVNPTDGDIYTRVKVEIYVSIDGGQTYGSPIDLSANVTTYTFTGLTNGTEYTYKVRSVPSEQAASVLGAVESGIPYSRPIFLSTTPDTSNNSTYNVEFNPNGRPIGDYIAIGATTSGTLLVVQGTSSSTSNTDNDTITINFTSAVESFLICAQNAAGIRTITIPTNDTTLVFGDANQE